MSASATVTESPAVLPIHALQRQAAALALGTGRSFADARLSFMFGHVVGAPIDVTRNGRPSFRQKLYASSAVVAVPR